jgi:pyruvate,orthophosphate dikinase
MAKDLEGRKEALSRLLPIQRKDFESLFKVMGNLPITVRLLDPPLHEFLPVEDKDIKIMATELGLTYEEVVQKSAQLKETNPMLGHRGCRLGTTYPEISRMQARAILEAAIKTEAKGIKVFPEIMIPLTGTLKEMAMQKEIIVEEAEDVFEEQGHRINYLVGTMIEVPRAALISDQIATEAEFFSYGTNDLTQMTFGFSRDDAGTFLPEYVEKGILPRDPFQALDQEGVGQLIKMSIEKGKKTRPDHHVGICGEHGGEPSSVEFCHFAGLDYVSCSPFRVPIARIAAAQAAVKETVSEDIRSVTA